MILAFPMRFEPDGDGFLVQGLPPFTNVLSGGDTMDETRFNAAEALTGILQSRLNHGEVIPMPDVVEGPDIEMIEPAAEVVVPLQLRWAREAAGLTQGQLAERLGVSYQAVQRLERSGANPSIRTLARVARALGRKLTVAI
jgi:antitoxin HicB